MCQHDLQVSLGFTDQKVPVGTHMCLIFTKDEERKESLLKFLLSGLESRERMACFSSKMDEDSLRIFFKDHQISYDERKQTGAISLSDTSEVYFQDNEFDPDRMIHMLTQFYDDALEMGFPASRIIGEMSPEVETVKGGERLLEYECKISMLLRDHPITSVCQYDANSFDGATLMEVLKVHPQMIVNGAVMNNPFFIEPEEYLRGC
ncbi:MAG: MEDS domain-containing protein [Proteobacteria bacterium]|nr:MEDS domain-containing protein [Pseudomonadota bacterium]MBU1389386.1 MEDS domain-containing protein [Pseudomonadota bacterium]MBU1541206.1 MEDS domain-containing protein [Pseudomonadota bacterium]MBU2429105.1 MEDS domain-containing protein [Pseudomonadota bacterium]MBU2480187.1 MEDS domain-containing protein [Pseudomonadota bacterium]